MDGVHRGIRPLLFAAATVTSACSEPLHRTATGADGGAAGISADVVLTRQRDLLDRGLVNVFVANGTSADLVLGARELTATHFAPAGRVDRTSTIPAGRSVALQVPYGEVVDCAGPTGVVAELTAERVDRDGATTIVIPIGDTSVLDDIRARACTAEALFASADVALTAGTIVDDTVRAELVVTPRGASAGHQIVLRSLGGTVLFGVSAVPAGSLPVTVGDAPVSITLEFSVNRCDPHALAETTKKYALDVRVAIDDGRAWPVAIPVDAVVPSLDAILERCRAGAP